MEIPFLFLPDCLSKITLKEIVDERITEVEGGSSSAAWRESGYYGHHDC